MAPKEFHGRLSRFFKSSHTRAHYKHLLKEKMAVKRSICRTNRPQKSPKTSEFARPFPKSSKRILFALFLVTAVVVGVGYQLWCTVGRPWIAKWWPSPLSDFAASPRLTGELALSL
jgi:hypothetical protein